jgi:hypothetical protein
MPLHALLSHGVGEASVFTEWANTACSAPWGWVNKSLQRSQLISGSVYSYTQMNFESTHVTLLLLPTCLPRVKDHFSQKGNLTTLLTGCR